MRLMLVLALTLYWEARSEGDRGMELVASVIWNRAGGEIRDLRSVCLKPYQFSCWNGKSVEEVELPWHDDPEWVMAQEIARKMVRGEFECSTSATHYYNPSLCSPSWAKQMQEILRTGNHVFLKEKK